MAMQQENTERELEARLQQETKALEVQMAEEKEASAAREADRTKAFLLEIVDERQRTEEHEEAFSAEAAATAKKAKDLRERTAKTLYHIFGPLSLLGSSLKKFIWTNDALSVFKVPTLIDLDLAVRKHKS
eukprot:TRINITY_DN12199_c0_g1_i5.p1 TRINITY_DN12199_c0_g1~~TRINITY_DN12199_c0_g1_i5.p1  ORF type:complete len:143 (-),score=52.65 TRINITY_DN12199_c0_g1_i5:446-835(-)